jgi:Prokaryotic glutathione synthetase, ATP-grasp domain
MLLILTHSADSTADYLCNRLSKADVHFLRIDSENVVGKLAISCANGIPRINTGGQVYKPDDFTNVWLRRPHVLSTPFQGDPAEKRNLIVEWSESLEGFLAHIPLERWVNHPIWNVRASHKIEQLTRATQFGLVTPKSLVTQSSDELRAFWQDCSSQVIVKPLASGFLERFTLQEDSHIYTNAVSENHLSLEAISQCPTLFQELVNKEADVRITIVDNEIHAMALRAKDENGCQRLDIRRDNMHGVDYQNVSLPPEIADRLINYIRSYQLRFAAVDMAIDNIGNWIFFEVNPNGQWAWLDLVGASDIAASFIRSFRN